MKLMDDCPIWSKSWTIDGDYYICCLPCGHIFGMSRNGEWLGQYQNHGKNGFLLVVLLVCSELLKDTADCVFRVLKCYQCNAKCKLKDVRKLFA
ncbi:hypothetical protein OROMI_016963 [Orobanche minor]